MNLQQLEYIVAVGESRHFAKAAEKCFVTQPTLSMMVRKLEEELGMEIFDRRSHPIKPTAHGLEIIAQASGILRQVQRLKNFSAELKGEIAGELRLAVIPTLAPYLLPLFLQDFHKKYPLLNIHVKEMVTDDIISKLVSGDLDIGLLATPLNEPYLKEHFLFYEEFFVYASKEERLPQKKYLLPKHIDVNHLWLLEEGHCLRNQVLNLCELKKGSKETLNYEAGSIETLINLVDHSKGLTIIPRLAEQHLKPAQRKKIREFAEPKPVREISLVASADYPRTKLIDHLKSEIVKAIPDPLCGKRQKLITDVRLD